MPYLACKRRSVDCARAVPPNQRMYLAGRAPRRGCSQLKSLEEKVGVVALRRAWSLRRKHTLRRSSCRCSGSQAKPSQAKPRRRLQWTLFFFGRCLVAPPSREGDWRTSCVVAVEWEGRWSRRFCVERIEREREARGAQAGRRSGGAGCCWETRSWAKGWEAWWWWRRGKRTHAHHCTDHPYTLVGFWRCAAAVSLQARL